MYLFLGYLDGASQFAQSCRGGGGDTSLPWDRNPAEDGRRRLPLHDASPQDAETITAETRSGWKTLDDTYDFLRASDILKSPITISN